MPGMYIYGELYRAQLENKTSAPSAGVKGRLYYDTTELRAKFDNNTSYIALLGNDQKCVFGTSGTAAQNIRLNRAAAATLQFVTGDDVTAEGALSTSLAQISAKIEGYATGAIPAAGNAGRLVYDTTLGIPKHDNGASFISLVDLSGTQTLTNKTLTTPSISAPTITTAPTLTQVATPSNPGASNNKLYFKSDNNLYSLSSAGTETQLQTTTNGEPRQNFLLNSNFDFWQRGTSTTVANAATGYQADRWYVKNLLGTNGVITFSRVTGTSSGALYGASIKITTAPTASQVNGCELYQTIGNLSSLSLYGQTASFSIQIKALGNVNQCGVQFYYKTTEAKVDTAIGSEQTVTVNTSTFVAASISGQALGTSQTAAGVIGVRIRITTASSGNTYDLNNGFVVEQGILTVGTTSPSYQRAHKSIANELAACQRFYEKSYDIGVAPGTSDNNGSTSLRAATTTMAFTDVYKVTKNLGAAGTTVTMYSTTGASGKVRDESGAADISSTASYNGDRSHRITLTGLGSGNLFAWHWTCESEI